MHTSNVRIETQLAFWRNFQDVVYVFEAGH